MNKALALIAAGMAMGSSIGNRVREITMDIVMKRSRQEKGMEIQYVRNAGSIIKQRNQAVYELGCAEAALERKQIFTVPNSVQMNCGSQEEYSKRVNEYLSQRVDKARAKLAGLYPNPKSEL